MLGKCKKHQSYCMANEKHTPIACICYMQTHTYRKSTERPIKDSKHSFTDSLSHLHKTRQHIYQNSNNYTSINSSERRTVKKKNNKIRWYTKTTSSVRTLCVGLVAAFVNANGLKSKVNENLLNINMIPYCVCTNSIPCTIQLLFDPGRIWSEIDSCIHTHFRRLTE